MVERTALITKYYNKKVVVEVEKLIPTTYHSKKMKYLISYCNRNEVDTLKGIIKPMKGIVSIEETKVDMSAYDFEE